MPTNRSFYGKLGIDISDSLEDGLLKMSARVRKAAIVSVEAAIEPIVQRAYELANVSPGVLGHGVHGEHMRDEIQGEAHATATGAEARIGVSILTIPYAADQEFGDRGKPYLRPAIDEGRQYAHIIMAETFQRSLRNDDIDVRTFVRFRRIA